MRTTKNNPKILALDFDGVIADSQLECFIIGYNSYLKTIKNTNFFDRVKLTYANNKHLIGKYKYIYNQYKKIRPFAYDGFSHFVLLYSIENGIKLNSGTDYDNLRIKLVRYKHEYEVLFYKTRHALMKKNFENWLKLTSPYKGVISAIKNLQNFFILVIATTKDQLSVSEFLKKYNIKHKFIAGREISIDKEFQMSVIKKRFNINYRDIWFIDDNIQTLVKLKKKGINCILAEWGYNSQGQKMAAINNRIPILRLKNVDHKIITHMLAQNI